MAFQSTAQHRAGRNLTNWVFEAESRLFQSTAQHRAGRNPTHTLHPRFEAIVSIHRPAQSRAEPTRRVPAGLHVVFQSTAQHRAGRNVPLPT